MTPPSDERPQRLSSIEYGPLDRRGDRDAVLLRVGDLLVAAHLPLAHRRDHLEVGRERRDRRLDAHLVVALAGAAVGDRVGVVLARGVAGELGQQGPAERGEQRIAALVAGVRADRRGHVVAGELLLGVHHEALDGPEVEGLLPHRVEVVGRLAQVDAERHDLGVVLVLDPLQHHRGVQAARVEEDDAMHLVGLGEVARDGRYGAVLGHVRSLRSVGAGSLVAAATSTSGGTEGVECRRIPPIR